MRKLLVIAGAVCALALFTASAQAAHGCSSGYGYGGSYYGGHGGYRSVPSYNYGYRGHGHGYNSYYAPRRVHSYHGHGHNHYGPGLHIGGRRLHVGFHF